MNNNLNDPTHTACSYIGPASRLRATCTAQPVEGRSYCEEHLWLVYQKGSAVNRKKDRRIAEQTWDIESAMNDALNELEAEGWTP